eukprot:356312-Chlamydomonas_euryale.AAC.3
MPAGTPLLTLTFFPFAGEKCGWLLAAGILPRASRTESSRAPWRGICRARRPPPIAPARGWTPAAAAQAAQARCDRCRAVCPARAEAVEARRICPAAQPRMRCRMRMVGCSSLCCRLRSSSRCTRSAAVGAKAAARVHAWWAASARGFAMLHRALRPACTRCAASAPRTPAASPAALETSSSPGFAPGVHKLWSFRSAHLSRHPGLMEDRWVLVGQAAWGT